MVNKQAHSLEETTYFCDLLVCTVLSPHLPLIDLFASFEDGPQTISLIPEGDPGTAEVDPSGLFVN